MDNETCCAVCGDEIAEGSEFDNGYVVTCADCSDEPEEDDVDGDEAAATSSPKWRSWASSAYGG